MEEKAESVERKVSLLGKRFGVVLLCNIKSCFMSIDSSVLYGIMRDMCPEFFISNKEFTGQNRETYWRNRFDSSVSTRARKGYARGDRNRCISHACALSALNGILSSSVVGFALGEAQKEEGGPWNV